MKIAIAHAAFLPERAATLERLLEELRPQTKAVHVLRSEQREHASVWAIRLWEYAAAVNDDCLLFNDDVMVSPHIVEAAMAMMSVNTSRMISLHTVHPMARSLAEAGQRWLSTYHLTGPAYILRKGVARQLLDYVKAAPRGWVEGRNEDNWAIQLAFRHREPIWGSLPALAIHDTTIPSSLGYDNHPGRVSPVPWNEAEVFPEENAQGRSSVVSKARYWEPTGRVPFVDTHWTQTSTLLTTEIALSLGIEPETCWWCGKEPFILGSDKTGARIGAQCLHGAFGTVLNQALTSKMAKR